ncbi:hypothetical protein PPERSA_02964 [Pseudocohnilembus persalinus]|uniref:RING-type domain-containing protein n=1 Tax=Pseudocohnilembus persalinus TaxID=266149 RepID=A0A0V0QA68_PSEPJ|nr:hypothetical protein PPERSA_02964 [Pseudocohnilembus persalinus]|eukprot:KRW99132.1 hypothetical protein PPERSA_02964 [Pseudocohnilembus persalinus]
MLRYNQYYEFYEPDQYSEQENESGDSSIQLYTDQYLNYEQDQDSLDNFPLQQNHGLNIFNHQNFQNQFQNNEEFVVQVKFSLNENFKQIEQEAINKIGQLFGIQQKPLYQKAPNKNGNQTITLEYKTQSEEKSTELVRNFNLFDPGFQTIYVEKKIKPREFWLMRELYEVILESKKQYSKNLRDLFEFIFDNYGEIFRLQIHGKNKKQVQVIFTNQEAYDRFLDDLYEEEFNEDSDNNEDNYLQKKYFYFNDEEFFINQFSFQDSQKNFDNNTNLNDNECQYEYEYVYEDEYDMDQQQQQHFGSNQSQNNFDLEIFDQYNEDQKKQLNIEQEEHGKLFKITNLKNILNVTSKLKEFGDIHYYDYQLKPLQFIKFRYNTIFSDQLMIRAYQNLEFSKIDNMDIKIEMANYEDPQQYEILCQNMFYNQCENKLANKKQTQINNEKKEYDEKTYQNICIICNEQETTTLFLPCEHFGTCKDCSESILSQSIFNQNCPFCQNKILENIQLVYE